MSPGEIEPGSFRDPSGYIFSRDGILYRQVNVRYKDTYDALMASGLYDALVNDGLLIPHAEADIAAGAPESAYKVIQPERIPFISYPYEWCFSQLRDAALVTLAIQKKALDFGFTLKDASAYNIQFERNKPVFIDTLSFERYTPGTPWLAYKQFCQHFIAPLFLMHFRDPRLIQLHRVFIDGIPLDLASGLLPQKSWLSFPAFIHIHMHARSQKRHQDTSIRVSGVQVPEHALRGLLDNLEKTVKNLDLRGAPSEWLQYYTTDNNYTQTALEHKREIVSQFLLDIRPRNVWDLGANIGTFSQMAALQGIDVVSFDLDPLCVEAHYRSLTDKEWHILPLVLDLTNPSPGIGWANSERKTLSDRGPADCAMALALVHHLAISNNVPLSRIAEYLAGICRTLIIEFVPETDSQVHRLMLNRESIFSEYNRGNFERAFSRYFEILNSLPIRESGRVVYLMQTRKVL